MIRISVVTMKETLSEILGSLGFDKQKAFLISDVMTSSSVDGVQSHGINRFALFVELVEKGIIDPSAEPVIKLQAGAMEQYDGRRGPGILNALFCTERAITLAKTQGLSCIGLSNTNHWLRGGTYAWKAAEEGCISIMFTNTKPNMPPWGASKALIGNNPLVLGIPSEKGHIVLDMAMSMFSYGKLNNYKQANESLPFDGGFDEQGNLTRNPAAILATERLLPAGFWKGSGLSVVIDLMAGILSGGNTVSDIGKLEVETGLSQVFICINPLSMSNQNLVDEIISKSLSFMKSTGEHVFYPGERTLKTRNENLNAGIPVDEQVWNEILAIRSRYV
ncbi:MAG: 3-dehydro-L-gulonate 2-dehydrogenase [Cyclobacteriaceae bacterium]|nr:3-dehydro-L-gulonate 2-dehydrogenase [Cyclobacteriaceae bacterium]